MFANCHALHTFNLYLNDISLQSFYCRNDFLISSIFSSDLIVASKERSSHIWKWVHGWSKLLRTWRYIYRIMRAVFFYCQEISWKDPNQQWIYLVTRSLLCLCFQSLIHVIPLCHRSPSLSKKYCERIFKNPAHVGIYLFIIFIY